MHQNLSINMQQKSNNFLVLLIIFDMLDLDELL